MLTALDAIRNAGLKLKSNIKFAFDGEEEIGSPNLEHILEAHREVFAADVWLMCDGPVYQTRQPLIVFGARGTMALDITVYGARGELHSGHYGNWAPNPALSLARLLASMKDEHGGVAIRGFYDEVEPLGDVEKQAIAEAPVIDKELMDEFWLGSADGAPRTLNELITVRCIAQHPRDQQRAHRRPGLQCDSCIGQREPRHPDGERDDRRAHPAASAGPHPRSGLLCCGSRARRPRAAVACKGGHGDIRTSGGRKPHVDELADLSGGRPHRRKRARARCQAADDGRCVTSWQTSNAHSAPGPS